MVAKKALSASGRAPVRSFAPGGIYSYDSVQITPDGARALVAGWRGPATWDLASGQLVRNFRSQPASTANWQAGVSPDGSRIVTGYGDGCVYFLDATTGAELHKQRFEAIATSVSIAARAPRVVTGEPDKKIRVWDLMTGEHLFELGGHRAYTWKAVITADATIAASVGSVDPTIHCWDLVAQKELEVLSGHTKAVVGLAVAGDVVASASRDGTTRLWRLTASARGELCVLRSHPKLTNVALSADGRRVATCGGDMNVRVWDVASATEVELLTAPEALTCVAFSPDGAQIVAGGKSLHVF